MIAKYAESRDIRNPHSWFSSRAISILMSAFVLLLLSAPGVMAQTDVDFYCSLSPTALCHAGTVTGAITNSGSNFSTTGIQVFNDSGPYAITDPFTLAFNTATGTISIDGTGAYLGQNLIGTILSFTVSKGGTTTDYSIVANWPTLPPAVQAQLGTAMGVDSAFIITLTKGGIAQSIDVLITPTPEPASMFLFGSGLLMIGAMIRRRVARKAATV